MNSISSKSLEPGKLLLTRADLKRIGITVSNSVRFR
jgi:hypothetical protein